MSSAARKEAASVGGTASPAEVSPRAAWRCGAPGCARCSESRSRSRRRCRPRASEARRSLHGVPGEERTGKAVLSQNGVRAGMRPSPTVGRPRSGRSRRARGTPSRRWRCPSRERSRRAVSCPASVCGTRCPSPGSPPPQRRGRTCRRPSSSPRRARVAHADGSECDDASLNRSRRDEENLACPRLERVGDLGKPELRFPMMRTLFPSYSRAAPVSA